MNLQEKLFETTADLRARAGMQQTRARLRETETLLTVSQVVGSTLYLQEVARRITREVARSIDADSAGIYIFDKGALRPLAGTGSWPTRITLAASHSGPPRKRTSASTSTFLRGSWSQETRLQMAPRFVHAVAQGLQRLAVLLDRLAQRPAPFR